MGCFGGPGGQEKQIAGEQQSLAQMLDAAFQTNFGKQSQIYGELGTMLTPIAEGTTPSVTAAEQASLNTAAVDMAGSNYANAARAVGGQLAGRSGSSGLDSGVERAIRASLASQGAGATSAAELANTQFVARENIAGRERAQGALQQLGGAYNPLGFAGAAGQNLSTAFGEADKINTEQNQADANMMNFGTSLALDVASGGMGAAMGIGPAGMSGAGSFGLGFLGGQNALANG